MPNKLFYPTPASILGPSYFSSTGSTTPLSITWEQVFALITKDARIECITSEARQYRDQGDTRAYSYTKSRCVDLN